MSTLDLRALLGALVDHEVRFVVIGGVAVAAHGYVRATRHLDVVPDPSVENARRLASALAALEASSLSRPAARSIRARTWFT